MSKFNWVVGNKYVTKGGEILTCTKILDNSYYFPLIMEGSGRPYIQLTSEGHEYIHMNTDNDIVGEYDIVASKLQDANKEVNLAPMESQIRGCWKITDDIECIFKQFDIEEVSEDDIQNALLGLKTLYDMRFSQLMKTFETIKGVNQYE